MSRAEETVRGAAPNVDLREASDVTPFDRDRDERRIIECTCLTCEAATTIYAEPGRTRRWTHEEQHASHVIEYWRIDDETANLGH